MICLQVIFENEKPWIIFFLGKHQALNFAALIELVRFQESEKLFKKMKLKKYLRQTKQN